MIVMLRGKLVEATLTSCVLDVHGVGYEIKITSSCAASLPEIGKEAMLYTRLQVREDAQTLFGFSSKEERTLFDKLVSISGVGPKMALSALSTFSASELYMIVTSDDVARMSHIPGVGKKMAQRLILELKSMFAKDKSLVQSVSVTEALSFDPPKSSAYGDAQAALVSFGFSEHEIERALADVVSQDISVEEMLSHALRKVGMNS